MSLAELKKLVGDKKLIIGTDRTMKELTKGGLKEIFLSSNCSKETKENIETHAGMFKVKVSTVDITNDDMGVLVKKPFAVSVVSLLK